MVYVFWLYCLYFLRFKPEVHELGIELATFGLQDNCSTS